jgi:hypothetical protein
MKRSNEQQPVFDQYPWAANHNDAIGWIVSYMDINIDTAIKQFDERILGKVAKTHL